MSKYQLPDDMPPLRPGSKVSVQIGDQLYTDTIHSIHTTTPAYVPQPEPSRWRRILRAITPRLWRKPLWTPPSGRTSTVIAVGDGPVYELGKDIVPGKRTTWPEIVAEMAQSEPDDPKAT